MSSSSTIWTKCFICQKSKKGANKEGVRSTLEGLEGIGRVIDKLIERNEIDATLSRLKEELNDNSATDLLLQKKACYHHTCVLRYNKKSKNENGESSNLQNALECTPRTSKRKRSSGALGELRCLFCSEEDILPNLCVAGVLHAKKKKPDANHLRETTEKWRNMATEMGNLDVSHKIVLGDINSSELYYHRDCLTHFHNTYNAYDRQTRDNINKLNTETDKWWEEYAFSKVINFIYQTERENQGSSFSVKALEDKYIDLLERQGLKTYSSHVTRFTERLLKNVDGLIKDTSKKTTIVYFQKNVSSWMHSKCDEPNVLLSKMRDLVEPIRVAIGNHKNNFNSRFSEDAQVNSVPMILMTFISMLIDGTDTDTDSFSQGALSAAQIIMYNFRKKSQKNDTSIRRHSKTSETPLVIYNSMKVYSDTRSKTAIDELHKLGLGISYLRVLDITKNLYDSQRSQYEQDGVLVPCVMRKNIFTILAKDNIDLNARSTTAKSHYHGTSLSALQYPTVEHPGEILSRNYQDSSPTSKKLENLPQDYCFVGPLPFNPRAKDIFAPMCNVNLPSYMDTLPTLLDSIKVEYQWLSTFIDGKGIAWAKHHSSYQGLNKPQVGVNAILPMINKEVHTLETQYHVMSLNKKMTTFLNPSQVPVDTCDQPVYALTKTIQWMYPNEFGQSAYMSILGGLHIEQSILVMHGELVNGSGLSNILNVNDLSIIGTSAVVDVNDIKRARYCLQVAACAIYKKLHDAHVESNSELSLLDWIEIRSAESEMCYYWKLILDFQVLALVFIRSIREGNFQTYVESLISICKWYFSLDHYHYARWCTVHCFDLMLLQFTMPEVYNEFKKGNFTFQKTNSNFSRVAIDQVHEQNNKVIKSSGGAKHLLNVCDDSGLIRWETVGSDVARILTEFQETIDKPVVMGVKKHHEDSQSFNEAFTQDVLKVYNGMVSNPFKMNSLTNISNTSMVFPGVVYENISKLKSTGNNQFQTFLEDRLIKQKLPIDAKITKNQFVLPGLADVTQTKMQADKNSHILKEGTKTKLRAALEYRKLETTTIFNNEFTGVAHSIAQTPTTLYHAKKSAIMDKFKPCSENVDIKTNPSAIVIEMSAMIMMKANCNAETFHDFALILYNYIMDIAKDFERVDIVCDQYFDNSLKEGTRSGRGQGSLKLFEDGTKFPEKMRQDFLKHNTNKSQLNKYLAEKFMSFHKSSQSLTITYGNGILTTNEDLRHDPRISCCTSEEADPRLVRHAISCLEHNVQSVIVRTVDTDVFILLVTHWPYMSELGYETSLYCLMGSDSRNLKCYNIKEIAFQIGHDLCKGLAFFYALTGCDTVSSMFGFSKVLFWEHLSKQPNRKELLEVFEKLGCEPEEVTAEQIKVLERFVLRVYYPNKPEIDSLGAARADQFHRQAVSNLRKLPPSLPALRQHIKRACFQGGWLWRECLHNVVLPDAEEWGWKIDEHGRYTPLWQEQSSQGLSIDDVTQVCSCRGGRCKKCKCTKREWSCLPFCGCGNKCRK